jgi:hypothetical protein
MHTSPQPPPEITVGRCLKLIAAGVIFVGFGTLGLAIAVPKTASEARKKLADRVVALPTQARRASDRLVHCAVQVGVSLSGVPTR